MGDLVLATPFLQAACQRFEVTLLAKPYAHDLQRRFWPSVRVFTFSAPWTAFRRKYRLHRWPWRGLFRLRRQLATEGFQFGLSARWDPRDHLLLWLSGVERRLGFPRLKSQFFLTDAILRPAPTAHRYEHWRALAEALHFVLPPREQVNAGPHPPGTHVLIHSGAGQSVRVWPLPRYRHLATRLRSLGYKVQVACDPDQREWWLLAGEREVITPSTVGALMEVIAGAGAFIGNDSGPSHLAAFCDLPTFTIFGPQLPEWFAPLHPRGEWLAGKPCPYKPCSDYCRFPEPYCMVRSSEDEVTARVTAFLASCLQGGCR